jgi:hypothetical protein
LPFDSLLSAVRRKELQRRMRAGEKRVFEEEK